jgi:hypothetical protein
MLTRPDHDDWRPDVWILNAILALWMSASRRESTSSRRLQRSSHICVLERNPIVGRTLSVVRTCSRNVRTESSRRPDRWCFEQLGVWTVYHVVQTVAGDSIFWHADCAESSRSTLNSETLFKSIITKKWFCPTEWSQLQTNKNKINKYFL